MTTIDTHNKRIDYGKHKGELFTRLPLSYLKWMVRKQTKAWEIAEAEIARRGTTTPSIEVSNHAIDRASLYALTIWRQNRKQDEGLASWLSRVAEEALTTREPINGKYRYLGMKLVFAMDGAWPVLKTVIKGKKKLPKKNRASLDA